VHTGNYFFLTHLKWQHNQKQTGQNDSTQINIHSQWHHLTLQILHLSTIKMAPVFYFRNNFAKFWPILLSLSHSQINCRKSWIKIYHPTSNLFPHYLAEIEYSTVQLYSTYSLIQCKCDTKSFIHCYLPTRDVNYCFMSTQNNYLQYYSTC